MTEELEYEKQLGLKDMEIKDKEVRIAELEESNKEWQRTCEAKSDTNSQLIEQLADLEDKLANADYQLEGRDNEIKELKTLIEKMKQDLDNARENANRQEQWEIYSVLNDIYNDNFEVITSVSN